MEWYLKPILRNPSLLLNSSNNICYLAVHTGTDSYRNLCIADVTGHPPTIWDRPGETPGNGTAIWGGGGGHGGDDDYDWEERVGDNWGNLTGDNWHKEGPGVVPGQMEVNECAAFPGLCGHGRCKNLVGTFTCDCFPGYEKVSFVLLIARLYFVSPLSGLIIK